ncbi:MFS transporter [Kordia periserrulae]|uniref:MFS transporter n=1 Tax=Kordia periserrulae TaxID=701523 RepID=A0A2T6BT76_9FLAO|nr:MFS transporter [Kordia periserrulae]PTX59272.1 MFS transporter [Kordia periserrulae]
MFEKLYRYVNNEQEERVCTDITEDACKHAPKNYFLILISNVLTKLGDTMSNPKTVLTWLMSYVNSPVYLISMIVPIRESGSMIPQIALASYVNTKAIRKWIWIVGAIFQCIAIASIGVIALYFEGATAGWLIIIAVIIFSISRSLSSLSSKDITGKAIPKTRRGRLKGYTTSVAGILVLAVGIYILYTSQEDADITFYSYLIFFAAAMWLIASLVYVQIKEFPGETTSKKEASKGNSILSKFSLLKTDTQFRNFVIARSLLLCSALTAPFYVLLAQKYVGKESYLLGLFIIAKGIASIISSPIWGKLADKSSKNVMAIAVLIASGLGILIFCIITFVETFRDANWLYPIAFFILGIAHEGVRMGRKTYVVDMATGNDRTNYVSVSNTIIGIILIITGGLSALVSLISTEGIILVLSLFGVYGAYRSYRLPNVEG